MLFPDMPTVDNENDVGVDKALLGKNYWKLVKLSMNFRSLNDGYELDILEDPLRRELLVVSTVPINNVSLPIVADDFGHMKCTNI